MSLVVQFDVDGVLADFSGGYDKLCTKLGVPPPGPDAPWDSKWNQEVWEEIKSSLTWWAELPSLVPAEIYRWIEELQETGVDFYFVTARPGRQTKYQTERWLWDRGIDEPTVIVSHKKAEIAHAIGTTHAIDDKAGNAVAIQYMAPKAKSYLLDAPYNKFDHSVLGTKVVRIGTVGMFLGAVETAR